MAPHPTVRVLLLACALAGVACAADRDGFLPAESRVVTLAQLMLKLIEAYDERALASV